MITLSILTCHLLYRAKELARLSAILQPQLEAVSGRRVVYAPGVTEVGGVHADCQCEWIIVGDYGKMPVGAKRNALLDFAQGIYVAYVDDDDEVSPRYIELILAAAQKRPDVVGLEGLLRFASGDPARFCHSIQYAGWYTSLGVFYRTPNHLNPVLCDIANLVRFPDPMNYGEDHEYSAEIVRHLKVEEYVEEEPLYFYNCPTLERERIFK
jgi:hypothetical protein